MVRQKTYNTSVMLGPDGARTGVYRKIHLFDIDLPGRVTVKESASRLAGSDVVCVASSVGAVGMSICYDLRFPELYRRLAFEGAKLSHRTKLLHFPYWRGALGIAAAGPRDRESDLRHRPGPIRP